MPKHRNLNPAGIPVPPHTHKWHRSDLNRQPPTVASALLELLRPHSRRYVLVENKRVELLPSVCKTDVLPLSLIPQMDAVLRIELSSPAYETGVVAVGLHR